MFGYNEILQGFTVIEGIDGAGTSTQRKLLCQALSAAAVPHFDTWEPTESPIGQVIRRALRAEVTFDPGTVARLFAADRHEHLEGMAGIKEQLRANKRVICDRYILSSLAYQGYFLPEPKIWELNQDFPLPAELIFVDVDLDTSCARRKDRGGVEEITETTSIQEHVRQAYHRFLDQIATIRPEIRIIRLDGSQPIDSIHHSICAFLQVPPVDVR